MRRPMRTQHSQRLHNKRLLFLNPDLVQQPHSSHTSKLRSVGAVVFGDGDSLSSRLNSTARLARFLVLEKKKEYADV